MEKYNPKIIEMKWQNYWKKNNFFKADDKSNKPKRYVLSMFPYPSGALHMGHVMNYTISDVMVRYSMMQGFNVLSPIGWDSFGLPAENAAIRSGIPPADNIKMNIEKMKEQMDSAGWGFDWDREITTSSENYYKWTQWLFIKFHKAGLVEQKMGAVNWCPSCSTVLANEQVHDGCCERCSTTVEQRDLKQWYFLMSQYSDKLLKGMDHLDEWPERVLKMQKEWIGRSEGATVSFKLEGSDDIIDIYTTRPDTLWGVTFMSMAPQHPLVDKLVSDLPNKDDIVAKINEMKLLGTSEKELVSREKEGVFTGKYAINPVNDQRVPIYVANFVLMGYGTGVVMAVPAHDQRDFEFSKKYNIDLKVVIEKRRDDLDSFLTEPMKCAYVGDGLMVNSGIFSGEDNRAAMDNIVIWLEKKGFGKKTINYKLRDWLLSRQRYWGAPIPIVHCDKCGAVPVPEDELPIKLPDQIEFRSDGESPLARCKEFINTICPKCGSFAKRESDTMDTFVDSSWYYLRYASATNNTKAFDKEDVDHWCPIDIYIGGVEHATMHLIYFRFFAHVLKELGLIGFNEPVQRLFCQGMVCKTAHYCNKDKWLSEDQVKGDTCLLCGGSVRSEVTKMSKTKLNVISPETIIGRFGADTMRMYILSDNPPDRDQIWSDEGVQGVSRFLNRLWETSVQIIDIINNGLPTNNVESDKKIRMATHKTLEKCRYTYEKSWQFNTAIARIIELLSIVRKEHKNCSAEILRETLEVLLKLVAPIAPHMCEELWEMLGYKESIFATLIPNVDPTALIQDTKKIVVQVNGKLRAQFNAPIIASKNELEKEALGHEKIKKHIEGKVIKKVIVIPGKLVNIVAI